MNGRRRPTRSAEHRDLELRLCHMADVLRILHRGCGVRYTLRCATQRRSLLVPGMSFAWQRSTVQRSLDAERDGASPCHLFDLDVVMSRAISPGINVGWSAVADL